MTMDGRLNTADRATLRFWQAANIIGWSLVSLALALFLRRGFESAADLLGRHSLLNVSDWIGYGEYAVFVIIPSSVVCGCLIGSIIGARVFWKPSIVAGVVAGIYSIGMWVIMRSVPTPHATFVHWINAALVSLTVLVGVVVAKRVSRMRPPGRSLKGEGPGDEA